MFINAFIVIIESKRGNGGMIAGGLVESLDQDGKMNINH
jgi:hypothetical protein